MRSLLVAALVGWSVLSGDVVAAYDLDDYGKTWIWEKPGGTTYQAQTALIQCMAAAKRESCTDTLYLRSGRVIPGCRLPRSRASLQFAT